MTWERMKPGLARCIWRETDWLDRQWALAFRDARVGHAPAACERLDGDDLGGPGTTFTNAILTCGGRPDAAPFGTMRFENGASKTR